MSSLRRNIKEAHSLLILTMTIQSLRHASLAERACTVLLGEIGLLSLFFKHHSVVSMCKVVLHAVNFVKFDKGNKSVRLKRVVKST